MSISGYEAFCLYNSLKLHFTTESYDFFKYGGKSRVSVNAFENRKDKYYFYKLSRRLTNKNDLILFLVANFIHDENVWVGTLLTEESETIYRQRQKVLQSLSYIFENDCHKIFENVEDPNSVLLSTDGDYPKLLTMALRKDIEIETVCILNQILNFIPVWSKRINDTIRWPVYRQKLIKYAAFIHLDQLKYKQLLRKSIRENEKTVS